MRENAMGWYSNSGKPVDTLLILKGTDKTVAMPLSKISAVVLDKVSDKAMIHCDGCQNPIEIPLWVGEKLLAEWKAQSSNLLQL